MLSQHTRGRSPTVIGARVGPRHTPHRHLRAVRKIGATELCSQTHNSNVGTAARGVWAVARFHRALLPRTLRSSVSSHSLIVDGILHPVRVCIHHFVARRHLNPSRLSFFAVRPDSSPSSSCNLYLSLSQCASRYVSERRRLCRNIATRQAIGLIHRSSSITKLNLQLFSPVSATTWCSKCS